MRRPNPSSNKAMYTMSGFCYFLGPSREQFGMSGGNADAPRSQEQLRPNPDKNVTTRCLVPGQRYSQNSTEDEEREQSPPVRRTTALQKIVVCYQHGATLWLRVRPNSARGDHARYSRSVIRRRCYSKGANCVDKHLSSSKYLAHPVNASRLDEWALVCELRKRLPSKRK